LIEQVVCEALRGVDSEKVRLSTLTIQGDPLPGLPRYQERAFAYEFFHQMRLLQDRDISELQGITQQAEVNKRYQGLNKIPDLILHRPNSRTNLAVFEFKLGTSHRIKDDISKLLYFRQV
jgi:hypothetical protein